MVKRLKAGQTYTVKAGRWLREEQGEGFTTPAGTVPIVIYLATLFKTGKPAATSD